MATTGTGLLDFGPATVPNVLDATLVITGQAGILAASQAEAWVQPIVTVDHSEDEHIIENITVKCGAIVPGTGFTIYGQCDSPTYGKFTVQWIWN